MSPKSASSGKRQNSPARKRFDSDTKRVGLLILTRRYEEEREILGDKHALVAALRGKLAWVEDNIEADGGMPEFRDIVYEINQLLQLCDQERVERERSHESG
jgi:hypothetical protein